jgi:hypothetical protein
MADTMYFSERRLIIMTTSVTLSRTEIGPWRRLMPSDGVTSRRAFQWRRSAD